MWGIIPRIASIEFTKDWHKLSNGDSPVSHSAGSDDILVSAFGGEAIAVWLVMADTFGTKLK